MFSYVTRRLIIAIPVLFGVTVFSFIIINLAPGSPVDMFIDPFSSPSDIERMKEQLGLNEPLWFQYIQWLKNVIVGDFGFSFSTYEPVLDVVGARIGPTLLLMASSLVLAYIIAIPIGILSATRQYSKIDYAATGVAFLGFSIPHFFLGLAGIYIFSLQLNLLPSGGMMTLGGGGGLFDRIQHLILPSFVLAAGIAGNMIRYVRASILEVLGHDYLRTARAKGLREFVVINKHGLRNALIPIITIIGLDIPLLIGGAVITEQIFQWPGMGQLTIQSIMSRDYSTLMALNLITAIIVLTANLLTDIMYSIADPRIKYK